MTDNDANGAEWKASSASLYETVTQCDNDVWRSRRARKKQIRELASDSWWSKTNVRQWRDAAEFGWGEGKMFLSSEFGWTTVPIPSKRAMLAMRYPVGDNVVAGFVAKAVGAVMAVQIADVDDDEARQHVSRLTRDPAYFAHICATILDDRGQRSAGGGPASAGSQAIDAIWESTLSAVQKHSTTPNDLSGNRSAYAPV